MATLVSTPRHPGEPLADGRSALVPHPAAAREPRDTIPAPDRSGPPPAPGAREPAGLSRAGARRRGTPILVSDIDVRLWFG